MKHDNQKKANPLKLVSLKGSGRNEDENTDDEVDLFAPHIDEAPEYYEDERGRLKELLRSGDVHQFNKEIKSFYGVALGYCCFSGLDLRGVNFSTAYLAGSDFTRSDLRGADFTGAKLGEAIFTGADLRETIGLTLEQLESAVGIESAKLPHGLKGGCANRVQLT